MATNLPVEVVRRQDWLEPIADRVQPAIAAVLDGPIGPKVASIVHGTWLGHPLHVVLTDVPLGCWTAAAVFDLLEATGSRRLSRGADGAVMLGLVGAAGTAVTGLADWSKIGGGETRRIGLVHGLLNTTATACYIASLCLRHNHSRPAGENSLLPDSSSQRSRVIWADISYTTNGSASIIAPIIHRRRILFRCWRRPS